ncbi:undecaprenyl-diphosphate phosphatase [Cesiribacter andamanensis]|uniref:Undecaprenyl-diphosphatase n=1 Tax=Cesiribacter andamanensis AMV16 TaxID=1279009 RepID=M7NGU6_9BACT|nr:undecaprenyl-diphosphate phosphatase [Cesiribacter andamanensis]EMR01055.1 Undecaprenyl-diphosphatase [Cesiribacter andamanensis AMV16]
MSLIEAIILGIIEGLTEFLPVSSTGHMILASYLMQMQETALLKTFEVVIQLGAILAIVWLYAKRFLTSFTIYLKLVVAFLPTGIIGLLAYKTIKAYLFSPGVVAVSLILGGAVLVLLNRRIETTASKYPDVGDISFKRAFLIGVAQCFSMIPGVSRAAATIIGGVYYGLDKKQAAEFSFLLAVPTMFAASGYDLLKADIAYTSETLTILGVGLLMAFLTAWVVVKVFVKYIHLISFKHFGYYRIVIGIIFLILIFTGVLDDAQLLPVGSGLAP